MMNLPLIRMPQFFPGQLGVAGSDNPMGLRSRSSGYVLYVDTDHPDAADTNDGYDPDAPLATIQQAVDNLYTIQARVDAAGTPHEPGCAGSVIVVAPGTYAENVTIDTNDPDYVTILGGGNGKYPVIIDPASGDGITCDAYGWRFEGLHFQPPDDGAGIKLTRVSGAGAEGTVIKDCFFNGGWGDGLYGVELNGAPANVSVLNCRFAEFGADSICLTVTDTSTADPYQMHVAHCTFQESENYIEPVSGGWNACLIHDNVFAEATGDLQATDVYIDLRGGSLGYNMVCRNCFGGDDYSNTGGWYGHAEDFWVGNYHEDTAEAEVSDSGITISPPA